MVVEHGVFSSPTSLTPANELYALDPSAPPELGDEITAFLLGDLAAVAGLVDRMNEILARELIRLDQAGETRDSRLKRLWLCSLPRLVKGHPQPLIALATSDDVVKQPAAFWLRQRTCLIGRKEIGGLGASERGLDGRSRGGVTHGVHSFLVVGGRTDRKNYQNQDYNVYHTCRVLSRPCNNINTNISLKLFSFCFTQLCS